MNARIVGFEQVAKPQDGGFVRQACRACIKPRKFAVQRYVVERFFHRRIGEPKPLLHEVNAQHRLDGKRRTPRLASRPVRLDHPNQLGPGHHKVHLIKKLALARSLGHKFKASRGKRQFVSSASNA